MVQVFGQAQKILKEDVIGEMIDSSHLGFLKKVFGRNWEGWTQGLQVEGMMGICMRN